MSHIVFSSIEGNTMRLAQTFLLIFILRVYPLREHSFLNITELFLNKAEPFLNTTETFLRSAITLTDEGQPPLCFPNSFYLSIRTLTLPDVT